MNEYIPIYELSILTENNDEDLQVFFLDKKLEKSKSIINIPFRRNFYAVGICLSGSAELKENLENNLITPNSLVTKPPYTLNHWTYMSEDFESLVIFFTKEFLSKNINLNLDQFQYFESSAKHVFQISDEQSANIISDLNVLKDKYDKFHLYRDEILINLISNLLYEIAEIYEEQILAVNTVQTRSQQIVSEFKKNVSIHSIRERSVKFYAEKLFITPKHLSETVKEVTRKTASEWIAEAAILEAKVLLQNPSLTASQVSDILQFPDSSTFGKFFKKNTGLSPSAYKHHF